MGAPKISTFKTFRRKSNVPGREGVKTSFVLKEKNPKGKLDRWLLRATGEKPINASQNGNFTRRVTGGKDEDQCY